MFVFLRAFVDAFWPGARGEDIQCNSVIDSLTTLDYTFFILPGWKHDDSLLRYYDVFRNMTSIIRSSPSPCFLSLAPS